VIKEILVCGILCTIFFLLNIRIFWLYKNNRDPLEAVSKPWWVDMDEAKKITDAFGDKG
jgi:hypothetical protein